MEGGDRQMSSVSSVLQLEAVSKRYRVGSEWVEPLKGANLRIEREDYVAITGPSGSGKSTLLHVLGCLDWPDSGSVYLAGERTDTLSDEELSIFRGRTLGFVFQKFFLLDRLTAQRNVELPTTYCGMSREQGASRAAECLEIVGLGDRKTQRPSQLSGGQQQRVAIARALVNRPSILLLDEPTGNLDQETGHEIIELLETLCREESVALVLVTHDLELAARANRWCRLRNGQLVEESA